MTSFLRLTLEVIVVPSTKIQLDFSVERWIIEESKLSAKQKFMTSFLQQGSPHR